MPALHDALPTIKLSDEERETGILTDIHLFDAVTGLHRDGVVVVENAIPVHVIDELNERMKIDTAKILNGEVPNVHWNQGAAKGNVSQVPPMEKRQSSPYRQARESS
jgi:hypothetical protein